MTNIQLSTDLSPEQTRQYKELIEEAAKETYFYGKPLDPNRERQVVLTEEGDVVGAFEFTRTYWDGRYYWRTNRPYTFTKYRGKGYMTPALREWYRNRRPALAWIDDENVASIKLFLNLGFEMGKRVVMHNKQGRFYTLES